MRQRQSRLGNGQHPNLRLGLNGVEMIATSDIESNDIRVRSTISNEQGWIHGTTVAEDWAGAITQKPLEIQDEDGPSDTARCRVTCPRLKRAGWFNTLDL